MWVYYVFCLVFSIVYAKECIRRELRVGNIVCVCNLTYCDNFEPFSAKRRIATVFESSKSGKRFLNSTASFKPETEFPKHNEFDRFVDITINRDEKYQKIIGFGGAFTDSATRNIRSLPASLANRLLRDYFASDGLQYSIGRVPIAGSDFSMAKYTYDETDGDLDLIHFKLTTSDTDLKIPTIKEAMNVSEYPIRLLGAAWAAPGWMKTNNDIAGAGVLRGTTDGNYYNTWANYAVKFLNEYRSYGINFWGMTTGNEPMCAFIPESVSNCLGFTPFGQRDFVKLHLGPKLNKSGYTADKFNVYIHDGKLTYLPLFADILTDETANQYIAGTAYHSPYNTEKTRHFLNEVHERFPNKLILSTETSQGMNEMRRVSLGNWTRGENYASDIIQDLNHWTNGWIDYNLALDLNGGPNWVGNFLDSPVIVNSRKNEYYKNPMFYAIGHFSHFLIPSSVRLGFKAQKSENNSVLFTVFQNPKNDEIVLVALNPSDSQCNFNVRDHLNGVVSLKLDAHSIVTLVWL